MTVPHATAALSTQPATGTAERTLRRVLALDAVVGAATSIGLLASTGAYQRLTGLPTELIRGAALALLVYVAALTWASLRRPLQRRTIGAIVAANVLWVLASVAVAATVDATALGVTYVLGQALVVVALATAEGRTLRRVRD